LLLLQRQAAWDVLSDTQNTLLHMAAQVCVCVFVCVCVCVCMGRADLRRRFFFRLLTIISCLSHCYRIILFVRAAHFIEEVVSFVPSRLILHPRFLWFLLLFFHSFICIRPVCGLCAHYTLCTLSLSFSLSRSLSLSLTHCTQGGHAEVMQLLLERCEIDVNLQNSTGKTALYTAVEDGHTEVVKQLLKTGLCDVRRETFRGKIPLCALNLTIAIYILLPCLSLFSTFFKLCCAFSASFLLIPVTPIHLLVSRPSLTFLRFVLTSLFHNLIFIHYYSYFSSSSPCCCRTDTRPPSRVTPTLCRCCSSTPSRPTCSN
jgi:hypothetical protein